MELHELLVQFGFSRNFTKVLLYFIQHGDDKSIRVRDIERAVDLRQPEVSIAIKQLIDRKWVKINPSLKTREKGRPTKKYRLAIPVEKIAEYIAEAIDCRIARDVDLQVDICAAMIGRS